jgi:multidrug efflux pump subunit AcrB
MWIVRWALRRPLSIAVMALLMLVLGVLSFTMMNIDIFPTINLPVVMSIWNYPGLSAVDMERRIVLITERAYSTTVNDIEHIESESIEGLGLIKIYFQPGSDIGSAIAQLNATSETVLALVPRGTEPPLLLSYNAANVPVAQLNVFSDTLSGQQLFDYGLNFIRLQLFTIPGFSTPAPLGGVQRTIQVNLNPTAMYANGLSPIDVSNVVANQSVVIPSGQAKMGDLQYNVDINMNPTTVSDFNHIPVKFTHDTPVLLGQIAPVSDTHQPQTNVVRVDGKPATYLMVIKHAAASTLAVVDGVKARIPEIVATAPEGLKVKLTFDQSKFVRAALRDVVQEAVTAAILVALMVLVFLGSPRSMLIVIASIPLSILTAFIGLKLAGQSINTMTLGGIALAVGMLVDDATVAIENIHRHHAMGKPLLAAILDGSAEIATPTIVGTLSICVVFFPVVLLTGVARFLFTPLALAVVFAMVTSYVLSRTLVTAMARSLLLETGEEQPGNGLWGRFLQGFEHGFESLRTRYKVALTGFIAHRTLALTCVALMVSASGLLLPIVGEDFFPSVDAGMMRLHVRAPTGTRIETSEWIIDRIERSIRKIIPAGELESISDNIGLPVYYDLAFYQTDSIGPQDADIMIQLKLGHRPTAMYEREIRETLARQFPDITSYFQAADIIAEVLNFGLSAAIDVQVSGNDLNSDYSIAHRLETQMRNIPGVTDLRIAEPLDYPAFKVDVDRNKALELGITENQVASSLLTSLAGNELILPTFWLDAKNGVNYYVISQAPEHLVNSVAALDNIPLSSPGVGGLNGNKPQLLSNLAATIHSVDPAVVQHYTIQRVMDVNCAVSGRDLGSTSADVQGVIKGLGKLPPGTHVVIRGQSEAMREAFKTLGEGIILAIVLVYLLMVANFQSWLEPVIILMALPGALAGVLWMLVLTGTTINVESMMGAIMAVGVGVANGNLLIIFANDLRDQGHDAVAAAIEAGATRFRPILMTALAMVLGMLPMALAIGEGSEQSAPLGRAVIGGLLFATVMTLFVVPAVYSIFSGHLKSKSERDAEIAGVLSAASTH